MNRYAQYQELEPGDHTKYHVLFAVAAPGASVLGHWGNCPAMIFGFNVKSRAMQTAVLPIGADQRCDFWTFASAMDFDKSEDVCSGVHQYTVCTAYLVYRHLSGVMGTDLADLPSQPRLEDGWERQLGSRVS